MNEKERVGRVRNESKRKEGGWVRRGSRRIRKEGGTEGFKKEKVGEDVNMLRPAAPYH